MRRFGLIGFPLSHSFSQKYFTDKFRKLNIADASYELLPLASIEELPVLLKSNPELCGLNVTIPYKQVVLPYLDDRSQLPDGLDACNCIRIEDGKLTGFNTDVIGFEKSFSPLLKPHHKKALILGSGGAAAAVAFCLTGLNIEFRMVTRSHSKANSLTYDEVDESVIADHQVIINTTPLGQYPLVNDAPPLPYHALTSAHYLYDLLYNPAKTVFLQRGEAGGATTRNGEEMLVIQAEESWRIWNE